MKIGPKEAQRRALRERGESRLATKIVDGHRDVPVDAGGPDSSAAGPSASVSGSRRRGRPRVELSGEERVTLKREQTKARVAAHRAKRMGSE
jgi:hypothetical protein